MTRVLPTGTGHKHSDGSNKQPVTLGVCSYSYVHPCIFSLYSLGAEGSADNTGNLSGNEDVVSLSDIIPETNICF